jgi:transcription-repair coupling factor (superfamily II helicase)
VLADMQSGMPMDRLVCGDVGFGKTEVAMRAAFLAVQDGQQVAVLVPTTLLAQQHYQNFCDRFSEWPVRIEVLSRFRSGKQQDEILAALQAGKIDIVVGTHKLLQPAVKFRRLGLLIIDEEHRFGVRQKEAVKRLRAEIDILNLTATPIPKRYARPVCARSSVAGRFTSCITMSPRSSAWQQSSVRSFPRRILKLRTDRCASVI